jgi:hypothetical protein
VDLRKNKLSKESKEALRAAAACMQAPRVVVEV